MGSNDEQEDQHEHHRDHLVAEHRPEARAEGRGQRAVEDPAAEDADHLAARERGRVLAPRARAAPRRRSAPPSPSRSPRPRARTPAPGRAATRSRTGSHQQRPRDRPVPVLARAEDGAEDQHHAARRAPADDSSVRTSLSSNGSSVSASTSTTASITRPIAEPRQRVEGAGGAQLQELRAHQPGSPARLRPLGQLEEHVLERLRLPVQLVDGDAVRGGRVAHDLERRARDREPVALALLGPPGPSP